MASTKTISNSRYAIKRGQLMKLISSLRAIGAQADLDLPQIVCIGNQSAGKSSLIEAISGIHVPRDSGTCTRCPMECRLASADSPWTAEISLRIEFNADGQRLPETQIIPFVTVSDSSATELELRRAQMAILNHGKESVDKFRSMSEDELRMFADAGLHLKFSKNPVCLDITGPNLTDLVFIDLPGIIQSAEEESIVDFVQNMVLEQIQGNSIILLTLPMIDDMDNQRAVLLRKRVDPEGHRTIGVLTKPDLLSAGAMRSREAWLDVIEGRKHTLAHGYYCTRQPEDADRLANISQEAARAQERDFFEKTVPWSHSALKDRFGTANLTHKLSLLLSQRIDESLPDIQDDIVSMLDRTNRELARLPAVLSDNPSTELLTLIARFSDALAKVVAGARGEEKLVQQTFKTFRDFKIAIRRTAPDFRMYDGASISSAYHDDSEVVGDEPLPSEFPLFLEPMYLQDLRKHIQSAVTRELPNNVPFGAKIALIDRVISQWNTPVQNCFDAVKSSVLVKMHDLVALHFGRFAHLQALVRSIVLEDIRVQEEKTCAMLQKLLEFEKRPFTQNDHYFHSYREKFYAHYKAIRQGRKPSDSDRPAKKARTESAPESSAPLNGGFTFGVPAPTKSSSKKGREASHPIAIDDDEPAEPRQEDLVNAAISVLAKLGYTNLGASDLDKLLPVDKYDEEITVAAEVRAFFQVSYKRIIDVVPQAIDNLFVNELASGMQHLLISKLDIGNKTTAGVLVSEDENVVHRREDLILRKKRLESAKDELLKFGIL